VTFDRSREDKGRAYYTRMEGKKERKMIGRVVLLHADNIADDLISTHTAETTMGVIWTVSLTMVLLSLT